MLPCQGWSISCHHLGAGTAGTGVMAVEAGLCWAIRAQRASPTHPLGLSLPTEVPVS